MKRVFALLFMFNVSTVFAENTIIAIVNDNVITYNSLETMLLNANSNKLKTEVINKRINKILQLQKANDFQIEASLNDINTALLEIANSNDISLEQLQTYPEFFSLKTEISEKISILNLQRFITKNIIISEDEILKSCTQKNNENEIKQIKIAQIIVSEIDVESQNDKDKTIKAFLKKLSKHISRGASFDAFAKLHSQHSSYLDGGVSDWIDVDNPTVIMLDLLKENEVSKIYLSDFGFAIAIKIDERFIIKNLSQCKEKLIYLNAEKFYSNWVKELRKEAYIKIYHDAL